ncbi:MAG TPA: hypothetical protein PKV86_10560 [Syntrophobacteraceae bacterium]|nr:hypothetical protein [Syntrophobacteraceae bacterium]
MRYEVELYPGYWIEIDPRDLYDDRMKSLADCLASGEIEPEEVDGTFWWTFDIAKPAKEVRIIPSDEGP